MLVVTKLFVGGGCVVMLSLWCNWMFRTRAAMKQFEVHADTPTGLNYIRADIGGVILGLFCFFALFLCHSELWAYPIAILMGTLILGRVISFLVDGPSKLGLLATVAEISVLGFMLLSIFDVV